MHYINHIDFFPVHANVCAQKSLKCTSPVFNPVTALFSILNTIYVKPKLFIDVLEVVNKITNNS